MRAVLGLRFDEQGHGRVDVPESDLESAFENLIRQSGLPMPTRQFALQAPDGRTLRIDFAYEVHTIGIELLGARFHAPPDRWRADIERLACLADLDWHMLQFTFDDVHLRPARTVRGVRYALARAGYRLEGIVTSQAG